MKLRRVLLLATTLAFAFSLSGCNKSAKNIPAGPPPTGAVELKLKWPVGSVKVQSMELKQTSETQVPGAPAPVRQEMTIAQKYSLKVLKELPDGGHEVEMEFLHMRMSIAAGNQPPTTFDSDDNSSVTNPVANLVRNLVGAKLQYFLDASNEVWKVEGLEEFTKRLDAFGNGATGLANSPFDPDSFKQLMNPNSALPGKPVKPGDTWPVRREVALGQLGTMTMDYLYTFNSWERRGDHNCARLEYTGTLSGKLALKTGGTDVKTAFEGGKSAGESWFDFESGRFVETSMNQDMTMIITMPNPQRRGATLTMTNAINLVTTFKLEPD